MGVIDTESYPPLPRELDPLPPSGGPMWRRQAPAQPLEDDLNPIVLAKATAIRQGRQRREEWKWKWIIVLSAKLRHSPRLAQGVAPSVRIRCRGDGRVVREARFLRPSIERSRIVRAVPYIDNTISGSWKPTALLLIALLLAIRIDHTSERKSAILFHIMAAIPGMGIHYQMSRHKKRDIPERQDTSTLQEKGLDLAR
ncbi:hypothetical protein SESBI_30170 [Sesbania bispinosa]|nr:hypothetical protein SESBI_30170 [Sesbania bispinosa]